MSLPPGFLDELRTRISLSDVVGRKVMWDSRKSNQAKGDMWAPCPFHQEKTASFHVDDRKGFYYCFGCHAKGDAISFVRETENVGFMEAVEIIAREAGMPVPKRDPAAQAKADKRTQLAEVMEQAVQYYRLQLKTAAAGAARDYLAGRGLSEGAQDRWEIGFAPDTRQGVFAHLTGKGVAADLVIDAGLAARPDDGREPYDRFRGRIIFPIRDARGRAIALGGRAMDPNARAKYLNSPETPLFHKGRDLYGLYIGRNHIKEAGHAVIGEGYMDVVSLAQFGVRYAVATLGTATTQQQLERLFRFTDEIVFCFDGDNAGRKAAWRGLENALPALKGTRQIRFLFMPDGEDPDTLVRKEGARGFEARLRKAESLGDFLLGNLSKQVDLSRLDEKVRLAEMARPQIEKIPDGALKNMLLDQLYKLSGQDISGLAAKPVADANRRGRDAAANPSPAPQGAKSKIARALGFLLQNPQLASIPEDIEFLSDLPVPGAKLLHDVLQLVRDQPTIHTGAILEHFHGTRDYKALSSLVAWQHYLSDNDINTEFQAVLDDLDKQRRRIHIQQLLDKAQSSRLTPDEQRLLNQLLTVEK